MPVKLKEFLQNWIVTTVAVLVAAHVVSGIHYDRSRWEALLLATLVLGLLNAFLRPVLFLLSLPLVLVTLGLFNLVINATLLYVVGQLITGFRVDSFRAAFWGGVVISLVSILLNSLTRSGRARIQIRRSKRQPPPDRPGDGGGPVIDI